MKSDNYLTLCLEQASKSPMHYRHGCIIVRGGKVIGQGYNDHRPGFNGGALKTGRIAAGALDSSAVLAMKEKLKKKRNQPDQQQQNLTTSSTFTPYESMGGGGHLANTPLSMHSEMAAIHSALATCTKLSSSALSCEKPCFKLPGNSKRKARLRKEALEKYVERVCATSARTGKPHVQDNNDNHKEYEYGYKEGPLSKNKDLAFQAGKGGVKHRMNEKKKKKDGEWKKGNGQHHEQNLNSGQQQQQQQPQHYASKRGDSHAAAANKSTYTHSKTTLTGVMTSTERRASSIPDDTDDHSDSHAQKKEHNHAKNTKYSKITKTTPTMQPTLSPMGQTQRESISVKDRQKHPRLNGADLYVARLGWCKGKEKDRNMKIPIITPAELKNDHELRSATADTCELNLEFSISSSSSSNSSVFSPSASGSTTPSSSVSSSSLSIPTIAFRELSLHDELLNPHPRTQPQSPISTKSTSCAFEDHSAIHASRPCYRCVAYMHSVGIRRAFWTNDQGEWEGGKVRDLIDAMDGLMTRSAEGGATGGGGPMDNGLFVTKHEVLMLRRLMGNG